jgi:hypothetical protein
MLPQNFGHFLGMEEPGGGFRLGIKASGSKFSVMANNRVKNSGDFISPQVDDARNAFEIAHKSMREQYKSTFLAICKSLSLPE